MIVKNKKILKSIVLLCFLCVLAVGFTSLKYYYLDQFPSDPVLHGGFPSTIKWIFQADGRIISTPAVHGETIFVKTRTSLFAVDVLTEKVRWKVSSITNQNLLYPVQVVGPLVIVVENQSSLAAYSIDNGELVWKTPAIEGTNYVTFSVRSIAFDDQNLYTARFDWGLSAYDLKTGEMIWRQNLPSRTSPHIAVGKSFVLLVAGEKISAFDAKSGSKLWDKEVGGYMGPILLDENTLYASDEEKAKLFSLDLDSGKINWEKSYLTIKSSEYYCISEFENNLLIAAQELLMVSKVNGEIIWTTDVLGILDCAIVFKDSVFVRSASTNLFSIDGKTGFEKGRLFIQVDSQMTHDFFRSPVIVNGLLVVPFGDDCIFVYQQ